MKNLLFLGICATTLLTFTSCGNRSGLYENIGPTMNTQGLKGISIATELNEAPFVCDRYSKDGCIDEVVLMGKLNRGRLQTCAAFFVGENLIATAKKCLPNKERDDSYEAWLEKSCAAVGFKDLKGYVYTCSSIENERYSEIVYINTKQSSQVGFLETTNEGINFDAKNKIFEITSFNRSGTTNYALSEGKYTRAKKECNGVTNSLISTLSDSKDSKNFVLSSCAIDWNSTGAPVLVDGKVAAMLHGKIEGDADFGVKISDRDGVAVAENFACQNKFNTAIPADCGLHNQGHKMQKLQSTITNALVNNGTAFDPATKLATIYRKDSNLLVLANNKATACASVGQTGSFQACKINLPLKNRFLSTLDLENITLDCDNLVTVNWKAINVEDKLTRLYSFEDYNLSGYHQDRFWNEINACE